MRTSKDLQQSYASAAAAALPAIVTEALEALGGDGHLDVTALNDALTKAFLAGVRAGEAEMMAQAAEQGARFTVHAPRDRRPG